MFKSIWKILGFLTGFSTQAETQTQTQAEIQIKTQAEVQAEIHTLIDLIKDDNFLEFKKRLSSARGDELLNTLKYISDNSGIDLRYISNISGVLRQEGNKSLANKIYNYSLNNGNSNILLQKAIETVRQDVEFENSALKCLQEHHNGKMAYDDHEKILASIEKARKEDDANKRFPNLMAFIKDNESAKESLDNIYWKQKEGEQFLYALKNADEGRRKEFLIDFITGKVKYSEYQLSVITEGINSSSELRAIFDKATKYVERDLSFLQKLQDFNDRMTVASSQGEKEEITKEFLQIKEEILEEKAQLPSTWQCITKNGNNPLCRILQTERENRERDDSALKSLKDSLLRGKFSTIGEMLRSVVKDELFNAGGVYKKTNQFINEHDWLPQAFDAISTELSKVQVKENSLAHSNTL